YRNEKIDIRFRREGEDMIDELKSKFNGMSIEINKKKELQRLEQALVDINHINSSADEEGGTTVGCENDASIQKSNGLATLEKEMETRVSNKTSPCETVKSVESKKMTRLIRKDSSRQNYQS
ncbi:hypothetical protein Tco_1460098, partial [Tanacetum coccineum]